MKALLTWLRRSSDAGPDDRAGAQDGAWACTDDLRRRWDGADESGASRLEKLLRTLRDGSPKGAEAVVDLRGAGLVDIDLSGLDLSGADLRGTDLSRANLEGTRLFRADLRGAVLFQVRAQGADFTGADLRGANLEALDARRAKLGRARLCGARAIEACFDEASLIEAELIDTDLRSSTAKDARMRDADLRNADFAEADLRGTELNGCNAAGTCFEGSDLRGAHLKGLRGYKLASWIAADVRDVDFAGAYMTRRFIVDQNFIDEFRSRGQLYRWLHALWWISSDCGRSLTRWSLWTGALALTFACAFHFVHVDYGDYRTWYSPFYFSIVTLTTLGYGDVLPASVPAQMLVTVEVAIGYLMLGGLISILSNKLARRAD